MRKHDPGRTGAAPTAPRRRALRLGGLLVALALAAACGEEEPDVSVPARDGQRLLDEAGVLDASVEDAMASIQTLDVVAVAYETPDANAGEAHRAGEAVVDAWDADVALVAVARPGDFTSDDRVARRRFFGVTPADVRIVPGGLREEIADEVVPVYSAENDWPGAFRAAAERLGEELQ